MRNSAMTPMTPEGRGIQNLLPSEPSRQLTTLETSRVLTLERQVPRVLDQAKQANVGVEYIGISDLFEDARVYSGEETDWMFAPADEHESFIVPRTQRHELERLLDVGLRFPMVYIAHELPKGLLPGSGGANPGMALGPLDRQTAAGLVSSVPPPSDTVEVSEQLNERTGRLLHTMRRALPVIGAFAISPVRLVGTALAALPTLLDPIILGAIPAISTRSGDPAAWYVLTRWEW